MTAWFKRLTWIASPFVSTALVVGCAGPGDTESDADIAEEEVAEAEDALAFNCVGICVDFYRACIRSGAPSAECVAEREACKAECNANTCEPSDPGCCQGQPTCW